MAPPTTSTPSQAPAASLISRGGRFETLATRAPVSIRRGACLRLRTHLAACRACADACPAAALEAGEQSLALTSGCTGCGRCQAACPTGALAIDGFAAEPLPGRASKRARTIDCFRVPQSDSGELRVPCLGGLSEGRLLALCASTDERALVLADRGWCDRCESGGPEHPARATLQRVVALMAEAGVPASRLPRIETMTLRDGAARAAQRDPMQQQGRARRGLFAALARPVADAPRRQNAPTSSTPSTERQLAIDALQVLAARHGGRMPAALFHRLEVGPACRGHRVCASACPTGALVRYRDDGAARMGLAFDNASCIGCGHCASVCPEEALQVRRGGGEAGRGHRPLTGFMQRECPDCGTRFALKDGEDETRCGRCRKSVQLARSAFQTLFGARP